MEENAGSGFSPFAYCCGVTGPLGVAGPGLTGSNCGDVMRGAGAGSVVIVVVVLVDGIGIPFELYGAGDCDCGCAGAGETMVVVVVVVEDSEGWLRRSAELGDHGIVLFRLGIVPLTASDTSGARMTWDRSRLSTATWSASVATTVGWIMMMSSSRFFALSTEPKR